MPMMIVDIQSRIPFSRYFLQLFLIISFVSTLVFTTNQSILYSTDSLQGQDLQLYANIQHSGTQEFSHSPSTATAAATFQLAFSQSLGYFDDVPERQWKIAQHLHAKAFPNHFGKPPIRYSNTINDKGKIPKLQKSSHWYAENFQEEFHCTYLQNSLCGMVIVHS